MGRSQEAEGHEWMANEGSRVGWPTRDRIRVTIAVTPPGKRHSVSLTLLFGDTGKSHARAMLCFGTRDVLKQRREMALNRCPDRTSVG